MKGGIAGASSSSSFPTERLARRAASVTWNFDTGPLAATGGRPLRATHNWISAGDEAAPSLGEPLLGEDLQLRPMHSADGMRDFRLAKQVVFEQHSTPMSAGKNHESI